MRNPLEALFRDARVAIRTLARRRAWTASAILCIGVAAGANTAAFTLIDALLLRPLPFEDAGQLVMVALREPAAGSTRPFALAEYRALAERSDGAAALLARTFFPVSVLADDGARMTQAELVSGNYFDTLGVRPFAGTFFDTAADRDGAQRVAVLSHRAWQTRFGGRTSVLGETVRVNGRAVVITGVAPPGFVGVMQLVAADLWMPASMYVELARSTGAASTPMFGVIGRLASGSTIDACRARLNASLAAMPSAGEAAAPPLAVVTPAAGFGVPPAIGGMVRALSTFIYGAMALLMIVACANVAALMLARGSARARELAIRVSLGATRVHVARQLLAESTVVALAGSAVGIVAALWLVQALVARLTTPFEYVTYAIDVRPDARVFAYSVLTTAAAAMLSGLAPLRVATRVDVVDGIKQGGHASRSRASMRTFHAMIVLQFAVSTALLVTAGTLGRTYLTALTANARFDTAGLVVMTLDLDQAGVDHAAGARMYDAIVERAGAVSGVTSVALTDHLPTSPPPTVTVFADAEGAGRSARSVAAAANVVSAGFFDTLGVRFLAGRSFHDREPAAARAAVVNESMARALWPRGSAVGRTVSIGGPDGEPMEVIGVVSDLVHAPDERVAAAFYRPFTANYTARMIVVARVNGDPARVVGPLRRSIGEVNGDIATEAVGTMADALDAAAGRRGIPAAAVTSVGGLGLLLSAVGLSGVVAYGVRQRRREIAVRLALGARPAQVRALVLRQGAALVALGAAVGVGITLALARAMRSTVFGVGAADPAILGGVFAVLTAAAAAALYLPALRASRVPPGDTLRSE